MDQRVMAAQTAKLLPATVVPVQAVAVLRHAVTAAVEQATLVQPPEAPSDVPPDAPIDMPVQRLERPRRSRRLLLRLQMAVQARAGL